MLAYINFSYVYITLTIGLTVYGQLVLKWRVGEFATKNVSLATVSGFISFFTDFWVVSAFGAAFGASLAWMLAIGGLPLSKAYPFMALNFVIVLTLAAIIFNEAVTVEKLIGTALIVLGVIVVSQSAV